MAPWASKQPRGLRERTIGGWLAGRLAEIEAWHRTGKPGPRPNDTRLKVWLDYLEVLGAIKVLDLACGSGAFLVAAFDYLTGEYERVNRAIAELTGAPRQLGLFDLNRQVLQQNLYGVDLNQESVEIAKLSLWLKTARRDKPLNNLDANIRCGNSLVEPPGPDAAAALADAFAGLPPDARAFDWRAAFPEVFARGGFDVDIEWKDGQLTSARILNVSGDRCRVRYRDRVLDLTLSRGESRTLGRPQF